MSFEQPISTLGVSLEKDQALADARNLIVEEGSQITIRLYTESKITRDRLNSIKKHNKSSVTDLTFYSFPIIYNPTVKQLEQAGMKEVTEVLIKTAMLDWNTAGFTMQNLNDIDSIRAEVIIAGLKYEIKSKQLDSQYSDTFLYIHLGLNRI